MRIKHKQATYFYCGSLLHRVKGPAIQWANGTKEWYLNGLRHRENGPAIERADGYNEWWLNNRKVK